MKTGTITWDEVAGIGTITLTWDSGERETVEVSQPINAGFDSHAIANLFGGADTVDHDDKVIHISRSE
tara:strand:+ start:317 stop:520 length:204 start_codon:yes stop_codon:yes gene_type:complete